jgi:Tfp pilus assembly protein PilO
MKTNFSVKRLQINKDKTRLVATVAIASAIVVFALITCKSLVSEASYLNRVINEKEKALKQLEENEKAVGSLVESYKAFASQSPNLLGGDPNGEADRDGDNGKLVLDALPSKYDFPALTSSLEKLLTGYTINSISGSDDVSLQQDSAVTTGAVEIPFTINVASKYEDIQKLTDSFGRSIRPFRIVSMDLAGTSDQIQTEIVARTYYQPEKSLDISTKVVK